MDGKGIGGSERAASDADGVGPDRRERAPRDADGAALEAPDHAPSDPDGAGHRMPEHAPDRADGAGPDERDGLGDGAAELCEPTPRRGGADGADRRTRVTVLVALGANLVIAVAKTIGGLLAGSPALLSEAAHSVADSLNEVFLLAALRRSRRPADSRHPFGYGKERFFWSLLAAVGIFVMGGCFSVFQGFHALAGGSEDSYDGYVAGLVVLGVALVSEGASLLRALHQVRAQGGAGGLRDPALRTVVAEDGTAVLGVTLAIAGMALHMVTGQVLWEALASFGIGALLMYVAFWLGRDAREQLIGRAAGAEASDKIRALLEAQPEIDSVEALLTMELGLDSTLVAARVDLVPGLDSERVEEVAVRIKRSIAHIVPEAEQIFLDVTDARAARRARQAEQGERGEPGERAAGGERTAKSPAATGERGGA
ncbi:cation diffusion facilitator family transporter [Streptomyces neyagawaensis]|uniref:Cation diffusion facilitator family transporter n=3 Tax=Streptomyces TaxID=1883 RepID=A0ABV3B7C3_9ACTN